MLGYEAAEVVNKITPADISDPGGAIQRLHVKGLNIALHRRGAAVLPYRVQLEGPLGKRR